MDRFANPQPYARRCPVCDPVVRWSNNPTAYDMPRQVAAWPVTRRPEVGRVPDQAVTYAERMYRPVEELEWSLFWHPIPDPLHASRDVWFSEDPVTSGLRANIVETGMSGPNPACGRGGYPGY